MKRAQRGHVEMEENDSDDVIIFNHLPDDSMDNADEIDKESNVACERFDEKSYNNASDHQNLLNTAFDESVVIDRTGEEFANLTGVKVDLEECDIEMKLQSFTVNKFCEDKTVDSPDNINIGLATCVRVATLPLHAITNTWQEFIWKCSYCVAQYPNVDELQTHSKQYHSTCNSYQCTDCNTRWSNLDDFIKHVREHRKNLNHSCYKCFSKFKNPNEVHLHQRTHYTSDYICLGCNTTFPSLEEVETHVNSFFSDNSTSSSKAIDRNIEHSADLIEDIYRLAVVPLNAIKNTWQEFIWNCSSCKAQFPNVDELQAHSMQHHNTCNTYLCTDCDTRKIVTSLNAFLTHVRKHRKYLHYSCYKCFKRFTCPRQCRLHSKTHYTSECICVGCNTIFPRHDELKTHIDAFFSTRFTCDVCEKSFRAAGLLSRHMFQHTGRVPAQRRNENRNCVSATDDTRAGRERNHICEICGKCFYTYGYLETHIYKVHFPPRPSETNQITEYEYDHDVPVEIEKNGADNVSIFNNLRNNSMDDADEIDKEPNECERFDENVSIVTYDNTSDHINLLNESSDEIFVVDKTEEEFVNLTDVKFNIEECDIQMKLQSFKDNTFCEDNTVNSPNNINIEADKNIKVDPKITTSSPKAIEENEEFSPDYMDKYIDSLAGVPLYAIKNTWQTFIWKCPSCKTQFPNVDELQAHSMQHHNTCNTYLCPDCNKGKSNLNAFLTHVREHRKYLHYSCYKCFNKFTNPLACRLHSKTHYTSEYFCVGCNITFPGHDELKTHIDAFFTIKYTCDVCEKSFRTAGLLSRHMFFHKSGNRVPAQRRNRNCVSAHDATDDTGAGVEINHICETCGKCYHTNRHLETHKYKAHFHPRPSETNRLTEYECDHDVPVEIEKNGADNADNENINVSIVTCNNASDHINLLDESSDENYFTDKTEEKLINLTDVKFDIEECDIEMKLQCFTYNKFCEDKTVNSPDKCNINIQVDKNKKNYTNITTSTSEVINGNEEYSVEYINKEINRLATVPLHTIKATWQEFIWKCSHCAAQYPNVDELQTHSKQDHSTCNSYQCTDCNTRWSNLDDFIKHVREHRKYLHYSCYKCFTKFKNPNEVHLHQRTHYTSDYICLGCNTTFPSLEEVETHADAFFSYNITSSPKANEGNEEHSADFFEDDIDRLVPVPLYAIKNTWQEFIWKCSSCKKQFPNVDELQAHSMQHHNTCNTYLCNDCGHKKTVTNLNSFLKHVQKHRKYLHYSCYKCFRKFSNPNECHLHSKTHYTSDYLCVGCNTTFPCQDELDTHEDVFFTETACHGCKKSFRTERLLSKHLYSNKCKIISKPGQSKTRQRTHICEICGKGYFTKSYLNAHKYMVHFHETNQKAKYECEICKRKFKTMRSLQRHAKEHPAKAYKSFICEQCKRCCLTKRGLVIHIQTHTNMLPYECRTCNKKFRDKTYFRQHMRRHIGEEPLSCEI